MHTTRGDEKMRKRISMLLLLIMAVYLVLGGSISAVAGPARKITGGFFSRNFFSVEQGWFNFSVREVGTGPGGARGGAKWKEYDEDRGWRRVQAHAICMALGDVQGQPAATVVVEVDRIRGWSDPAEFEGELMKFWLLDGGTPGHDGDQWSSVGPWPPTDDLEDYTCDYEDPVFHFSVVGGNLVIHD
jgi:hypothetical protein